MVPIVWCTERCHLYGIPSLCGDYGLFQIRTPSGMHDTPSNDIGQDVYVIIPIQYWPSPNVCITRRPICSTGLFRLCKEFNNLSNIQCSDQQPCFLWLVVHIEDLCLYLLHLHGVEYYLPVVPAEGYPSIGVGIKRSTTITARLKGKHVDDDAYYGGNVWIQTTHIERSYIVFQIERHLVSNTIV